MNPYVMLITEQFDPTADALIDRLRAVGQPYFRWNLDHFPAQQALSMRLVNGRWTGSITADGRTVGFLEIGTVWCRSFLPGGFGDQLAGEARQFAGEEARCALQGLVRAARWRWVNRPDRNRAASSKPEQLRVAARLGLQTPQTLVSNDPQEVRRFYRQCAGQMVYKGFTQPMKLSPGQAVFTGRLTERHLDQLEAIRFTPGIFQQYVPKSYELRITIVGETVFAVEIHSQENDATREDWRVAPQLLEHRRHELDPNICEKLLRFMRHFRLVYGAIDMIVTPEGEHVFIENNPGGQYGWLEAALGVPITACLADLLCQPRRKSRARCARVGIRSSASPRSA